MPLWKSSKKEAVGENIKREEAAGKKPAQAKAIALSVQREAARDRKSTRLNSSH